MTGLCAVCVSRDHNPVRAPETVVGPLEVCGPHVPDALNLIGYRTDVEVAQIQQQVVQWLESIAPEQLEQEALARMAELPHGPAMNGRAFLAALIAGARNAELS